MGQTNDYRMIWRLLMELGALEDLLAGIHANMLIQVLLGITRKLRFSPNLPITMI